MNEADRLGLPTVEELIMAAKTGHLDDRVERYLPDSLYVTPAPADGKTAQTKARASKGPKERQAAPPLNGRQVRRVRQGRGAPAAAKAAPAARGRAGEK